ncbi:MAG TPA: ABC transporter ATP-binding protein [bacterium]|nr:ABC transporter ATP-binding protein [bacterium]
MSWAVRFENVGKWYRGMTGPRYPVLRDDIVRIGRRLLPWNRAREATRTSGGWALDDVSFEVGRGESFALIGPNGAGKTTALKMLTRISYPTKGRVRVRGRVAALIDVGAGIHPELTGRENIWLYGRIMGMSPAELRRRFDEIVDFSEISEALDRPVKMYSSGMQLRLGFSVASHLDPDIFVIDEALAVGDAGFQAKCVERMMHLVSKGLTLLFVSHNLTAVEAICPRGLFLLDGRVQAMGETRGVIRTYLDWVDTRQMARVGREFQPRPSRFLTVERVSYHDALGVERAAFQTGEEMEIRLTVHAEVPLPRPCFSVGISRGGPSTLIACSMLADGQIPDLIEGRCEVSCVIPRLPLMPSVYQTWCSVVNSHAYGDLLDWQPIGAFRVSKGPDWQDGPALMGSWIDSPVYTDYQWRWKKAPSGAPVDDAAAPEGAPAP